MTANLFNSNDLEGILAEIYTNFNDFYAQPICKAAKATKEFVLNPKAYGWAALYGFGFGAYTYALNNEKDFFVKAGAATFRFASSLLLGRQVLRGGQLIAKKINNPLLAYSAAIAAPFTIYATAVYGTMSLMGVENLAPLIIADVVITPFTMFPPLYLERNNIELHPIRKAVAYIKNKMRRA